MESGKTRIRHQHWIPTNQGKMQEPPVDQTTLDGLRQFLFQESRSQGQKSPDTVARLEISKGVARLKRATLKSQLYCWSWLSTSVFCDRSAREVKREPEKARFLIFHYTIIDFS
ncbi:hypothetical protein L484_002805 [Morus notabilis]|uniref:Uncharacterized protein n=1 Tax=Morus notabilis TaxID=981085 RepID=W9RSG2_9ROSA|nr:hypothetical protein L484_002805 [Morus notabilis]